MLETERPRDRETESRDCYVHCAISVASLNDFHRNPRTQIEDGEDGEDVEDSKGGANVDRVGRGSQPNVFLTLSTPWLGRALLALARFQLLP